MKITLNTFGELECTLPSLSTCFDIISQWSDEQSRSVTGRLCAIAICLYNELKKFDHVLIGNGCHLLRRQLNLSYLIS